VDLPGPAGPGVAAQVFVADLEELDLDPADAHHLGHVLRLRPGETVVAADGLGGWRLCRVVAATERGGLGPTRIEAVGALQHVPAPAPQVTVAFVPVKGSRPEWAVQKLTEAGVDRIVVLGSARAVVRWEGRRLEAALERLGRVAREAAAQCRRPRLPRLEAAHDLGDLARALAPVPLALAHPGGGGPSLATPALAVGPEGGWDPAEVAAGYRTVTLGPHVLRAETAAVAAGLLLCSLRAGVVAASPGRGPEPPGVGEDGGFLQSPR